MNLSPVGLLIGELDTPALLVDLDALEHNIALMARRIAERAKHWRPHAKALKTPALAHRLIDAGAIGITVAKIAEAEVYVAGGVRDILIAHIVVGERKAARLAALQRFATVRVTVDHPDQLPALAQAAQTCDATIGVLVDHDIGLGRTGTRTIRDAVSTARRVAETPGLRFDGLMGYEGHALYIADPKEKRLAIEQAIGRLARACAAVRDAGLACPIVSAAGTGSYEFTCELPEVTELQAGGGIFACPYYTQLCRVSGHRCAIGVLASVVSRPTRDRAILDAGLKSLSNFRAEPSLPGYPESRILSLSAEHATVEFPSDSAPRIGTKLIVVPGYSDLTVMLHDVLIAHRQQRVEACWELWARGKLQ